MPPQWSFLLDRGANFRTKRELFSAGFPDVLQLADVGLTGLATDPEIFAEAQSQRLILIRKDADFIRQVRYALGHDGILSVTQSKAELSDTVATTLALSTQYPALSNMRFTILIGGRLSKFRSMHVPPLP